MHMHAHHNICHVGRTRVKYKYYIILLMHARAYVVPGQESIIGLTQNVYTFHSTSSQLINQLLDHISNLTLSQEGVPTRVYGRHACEAQSPPQLQGSMPHSVIECYLITAVASDNLVRAAAG